MTAIEENLKDGLSIDYKSYNQVIIPELYIENLPLKCGQLNDRDQPFPTQNPSTPQTVMLPLCS